ncbi:MAG: ABC transporter permease [Acidobacteriota bacterium]
MRTLWQDIRFGLRLLWKHPGFTFVAVAALALGIGANTAVFSLVNALLINPLPFPDMDRLVTVYERVPAQGNERNEASIANYLDWRAQNQSFENIGVYRWWSANLTGNDQPERLQGFLVSASLLDTIGLKPMLGRNFNADEEQSGKDNVAILSYGVWQRRFAADANIIGQTILLNGVKRQVVGVLPANINFPRGAEILAPLSLTPEQQANRGNHSFLVVGRLKNGVSLAQAQREMNTIAARLETQYPNTNTGRSTSLFTLYDDTVQHGKVLLLVLLGAVGFVLLIACANIANLMLARASSRLKEIAIRSALGASRWRVARQLLIESVIVALAGGVFGLLVGQWGISFFKSLAPAEVANFVPGWHRVGMNPIVLVYTLGLSVVTGLLFGLAPAWQATKPDLVETLKEGGGKSAVGGRQRLRSALVVAEVALSLVLLISAGLLIKSFLKLSTTDPGFNSESVLTMQLILPRARYEQPEARAVFYRDLEQRIRSLSGVASAGLVNYLPLGGSNSSDDFLIEGLPTPPRGQEYVGRYRVCTPDYFQTLGIRILRGRGFTGADSETAAPVVIVNETLVRKFWPNADPSVVLGKRFRTSGPPERNPWREIVGVINDVRHEMNGPIQPEYYLPHAQDPWNAMALVAKTKVEPMALASLVRKEVQAMDKDQPVFSTRSMQEVRAQSVIIYNTSSQMLSVFAAIAMLLAALGIYGVMSYSVSQRTHEIGVRLALGASRQHVLKLMIWQGMKLAGLGMVIGLAGALALTSLMKSLLFGVSTTDPLTYGVVVSVLAVVALLACYLPARRATKVDPIIALRYE